MRSRLTTQILVATLAAGSIFITGCAGSSSGSSYSTSQARGEMSVRMGVVEGVRQVQIEGSQSGVGAIGGAALGGLAGSRIGGGRGQTAGAIVGAIAGGVAGNALEQGATKKAGLEITIKLDNGQYIAVTQEADEQFRPGERVRVLSGQGATRVSH